MWNGIWSYKVYNSKKKKKKKKEITHYSYRPTSLTERLRSTPTIRAKIEKQTSTPKFNLVQTPIHMQTVSCRFVSYRLRVRL